MILVEGISKEDLSEIRIEPHNLEQISIMNTIQHAEWWPLRILCKELELRISLETASETTEEGVLWARKEMIKNQAGAATRGIKKKVDMQDWQKEDMVAHWLVRQEWARSNRQLRFLAGEGQKLYV